MEDEYTTWDNIPAPPLRKWDERFKRLQNGETLILHPENDTKAHSITTDFRQAAKRRGLSGKSRKIRENGNLKLYLWLEHLIPDIPPLSEK